MFHLSASQMQNVDRKTSWGATALHHAAGCGHVGIVELLLSNGADATAKDRAGDALLYKVALLGYDIAFALDVLISPSTKNGLRTEEMKSLSVMSLAISQSLLDRGADVNAINLRGETALHVSARRGKASLTRLFLMRGADTTLKDIFENAQLTLASALGCKETARL